MSAPCVLVDPLEAILRGREKETLRVGLAVPASGVLGLTGPAALASSVLAVEEVNAAGGVRGRCVELVPVDAGAEPEAVARAVNSLMATGAIEALCGFHTSDVHRRLERLTTGRIPYIFTPPHEGGSRLPGVALLGQSPLEQMFPVATQFAERAGLHRWAVIGNDYIWPHAVHLAAQRLLRSHGAEVVMAAAVSFGQVNTERLIERILQVRADAVLLSLVGRDLATFNRAYARSVLAERVVRVSGSLEETGLLEIDGDHSGELYSAMTWFASDPDGAGFRQRYHSRWGEHAPRLGVYAAGCYDGLRLLATLGNAELLDVDTVAPSAARLMRHRRSRLARAEGLELVPVP